MQPGVGSKATRRWIGAVVSALALAGAVQCSGPLRPAASVLLISIDTLRPDALSSYGNQRETSPRLDAFAREGVLFRQAVAASPWTIPSHSSMLTGLDPDVVGADVERKIPPGVVTVAEVFQAHGFATGAVVNGPFLDRHYGFDRGFDEFVALDAESKAAPEAIDRTIEFFERHAGGRRFFFLHLLDVHAPFDPPPPYDGLYVDPDGARDDVIPYLRKLHYHDYLWTAPVEQPPSLAALRARYDAGVARVDAELGRLFDSLRSSDAWDEALIVVTSDHGEAFFEHGIWVGHGLFLEQSEVAVPLLVKSPASWRIAPRETDTLAVLTDLAPTLLDAAGLPRIADAQGKSLVPTLQIDRAPRRECDGAVFLDSSNTSTGALRTARYKYIAPMGKSVAEVLDWHLLPDSEVRSTLTQRIRAGAQLYDLFADPGEHVDIAASRPEIAARFAKCLADHSARGEIRAAGILHAPGKVELSDEDEAKLRELGYVR